MSRKLFLLIREGWIDSKFWKDYSTAVWFTATLLLAMVLRIYNLGTKSYWVDEIFTITEGKQSVYQLLTSGRLDQPPAYYLPFHFWIITFGTNETSTRSFSVLAGISSIFLIYLIGCKLFGQVVGLLSAFLMAISGFQIVYSQETRFYTFFELTVILSFFFLILALKSHRKVHFTLYVLASTLMLYSHTIGVFILVAQNIFVILQGRKYRNILMSWLICQLIILLAFIPYLLPLIFAGGGVTESIASNSWGNPTPSVSGLLRSVFLFIIPPRLDISWKIMLANYAVAGTLLIIGTWNHAIKQDKRTFLSLMNGLIANLKGSDLKTKLFLVSSWLVIPIVISFLISKIIIPIYADRYMICAAPALYLLLALGIFNIRKVVPISISIGVLAILIVPGLFRYYEISVNEQWREAAAYVDDNTRPDETIVFASKGIEEIYIKSFNWYYHGPLGSCGLEINPQNSDTISEDAMQCISGHNRFWVIMHNNPGVYHSYFLDPNQTTMHLVMSHQFVYISAYLFEVKK